MSVHKDKNTGKWYYTGKYRDLLGNRHDYKKRGFRTKGEAKDAEEAFLLKIKGGQGRIKMKALIDLYNKESASVIKKSTLRTYTNIQTQHIIPVFGERFIDSITSMEVTAWNKERGLYGNNGGAYSDGYIYNMFLTLSALFTFACKHKLINDNPCHYVRPYKNPNKVEEPESSKHNYWEVDEFNKFISSVEDENDREAYEFLFLTGLRIGEFSALTWSDVDIEHSKIKINKSFASNTGEITTPKTPGSNRVIDISKRVTTLLKERYQRSSRVDGFNNSYYVFGDIQPRIPCNFRRHFYIDINKAGVRQITPHGLRHSHASYLLSNPNVPELLVAERMGHSVDMLRKTYAHIYEKHRGALVEYLDLL